MPPENDAVVNVIIVGIIVFLSVILLISFVIKIEEFTRTLKYINVEIGRTKGEVQKYWKKKRRRLWLSLLPFF